MVDQGSPIPFILRFLGDHHFGALSKTFRNYLSQLQAANFRTCQTASTAAGSGDRTVATDLPRPDVHEPQAWPNWLNDIVAGWDATFGRDEVRATPEERYFRQFQTGGQITITDPRLLRTYGGMKYGAIAVSPGRNFARAYCGLNLRTARLLGNFGGEEDQRNDAADGTLVPDQPGAEAVVVEGGEDEKRGVDSRGGAIARPDVTHPESGWVNQRPPRAEDRVLENAASGISCETIGVGFPFANSGVDDFFSW